MGIVILSTSRGIMTVFFSLRNWWINFMLYMVILLISELDQKFRICERKGGLSNITPLLVETLRGFCLE